jgi:Kef-type K+ transport system membrane component KefB/nucleotide-binding universal stress UspA family protein
MHGAGAILILFAQIALIIALSRLLGWLFTRLHQPQVMGEMVAGILLGPSLLGWGWPGAFHTLFPSESLDFLSLLSQLGVVLFLFLVGLELDPALLQKRGRATLGISIASIAAPFVLGIGLTILLYRPLFADPGRSHFLASTLFMGAAMSITAFPVLARILTERNLHRTQVGSISIACAAVNDVAAWCILAFVVAVAQKYAGPTDAIRTAGWVGIYITAMFVLVRPSLRRLQRSYEQQGRLSQNVIAIIFLLVLISAFTTDWIGIHALFGAFMLGFVMPKSAPFVRHLSEKLEDFTVVFLLPLFFANAGLKTRIGLLNTPELWLYTGLIVLFACLGKYGGTTVAARLFGTPWREASAVGVLMNTRGLMELIILTIGRELNVITDEVFAMMVIMAIATTLLTTPLLHWFYPARLFELERIRKGAGAFRVLIPVSWPKSGGPLVQLAEMLLGLGREQGRVYALHLRPPAEHEAYRSGLDEPAEASDEVLSPLLTEARTRNLPIEPISFASGDVPGDIAALARSRQVDLVLMGFHKAIIGGSYLGGTVHRVLSTCPAHVGIFVDRGLGSAKRILVPYLGSRHDRLALELAGRMARNTGAHVTVLHVVPPERAAADRPLNAKGETDRVFQDPAAPTPVTFKVVPDVSPVNAVVREAREFDLVIIGVAEQWGLESHLFGWRPERIAQECPASLLIVRKSANPAAADSITPGAVESFGKTPQSAAATGPGAGVSG